MPIRFAAAFVLALEALALAVLAGVQVVALTGGDTTSFATAAALLVLTVIGAAAVAALAVGTARGRSWGRSGGIVVQVLILAVALGELTGPEADGLIAAAIALPGVVGGVLLVLAVRAAGTGEPHGQD